MILRSVGLCCLPLISTLAFAEPALAQSAYELGRNNWSMGRYGQAKPPLLTHRATRGGRTAEVDYMLGTSGCRISGSRTWGGRVLNFILYNYPLSRNGRELVSGELQRCRSTAAMAALSSSAVSGVKSLAPGATASGKMWYSGGANPVPAHPARLLRPFYPGDLEERRVPVGQTARYTAMLNDIAPDHARVKVIGRYGFVTFSGHSDAQLETIAALLQRYSTFLSNEYGLAPPDNYISIYLSPDIGALTRAAQHIHHLGISPSTLGYAYPEDYSVSAAVSGTGAGTVLHELFHLNLRLAYGDMPQWLDEGIASLYEVSRRNGATWEGLPNWRGRLLAVPAAERPKLREVISSPWFDFDGVSGGAAISTAQARQLALARYLALYLQTRGLLDDTFRAFRDREVGSADDPALQAVQIVEGIAGPLSTLEPAFWQWFDGISDRDDNFLPGVESRETPRAAS